MFMAYSFNPNPILGGSRIIILSVILTVAAFFLQPYIERIFIPLVGLLWLIAILYVALIYAAAKFEVITLSETSVTHTKGVLSRRNVVLPYVKVTEATYSQTLMQRIFGVGTLHLDSAGGSMVAINVANIKKRDIDMIIADVNKKSGKGQKQ